MSEKDPKVRESGGYSEAGVGPASDAASFDKRTPFGGVDYRDQVTVPDDEPPRSPPASSDEPVYVMDDSEKKATPAGMLSRNAVRSSAAPTADHGDPVNTKLLVAGAAVATLILIVLGVVGVMSNGKALEKIDEQAEAAAAAKPQAPEDIQGVKVRKGIKHTPAAPAKTPGTTLDNSQEVELNAVPDGTPPPEGTPEPEAAAPEAPDAPDEPSSDIPSGDRSQ